MKASVVTKYELCIPFDYLSEPVEKAELNKLLNAVLRQSAKAHKWKCSRGYIFKATELLFFSINILGQAKQRRLLYSLDFKLLAFDDLFWKIVKSEESLKQPLSFRAFGAWTAPTTKISEGELSIADWEVMSVQNSVNEIIAKCELDSEKVANEIDGLDANMRFIERSFMRLKNKYPDSVSNIWRERLFTSILKREYWDSEKIVRDRIGKFDTGGFQVGNRSFYDLANEYLQTLLRNSN